MKFIFNLSQYIQFPLNLSKAPPCASLHNCVDLICELVKENYRKKKSLSLFSILMKGALVCVLNIHVLKIIPTAFCYNSYANAFVNQIFLCCSLPQLQEPNMKSF